MIAAVVTDKSDTYLALTLTHFDVEVLVAHSEAKACLLPRSADYFYTLLTCDMLENMSHSLHRDEMMYHYALQAMAHTATVHVTSLDDNKDDIEAQQQSNRQQYHVASTMYHEHMDVAIVENDLTATETETETAGADDCVINLPLKFAAAEQQARTTRYPTTFATTVSQLKTHAQLKEELAARKLVKKSFLFCDVRVRSAELK